MVFLKLQREAWGSSTFLKVNSGNLTCCLRKSGLLLSCEVVHGLALESLHGKLASFCLGVYLVLFLKLQPEALGFSRVVMGTLGYLSTCLSLFKATFVVQGLCKIALKLHGIALESLLGKGLLSQWVGISWCFSSWGLKLRVPLELPRGPQGTSGLA